MTQSVCLQLKLLKMIGYSYLNNLFVVTLRGNIKT